MRAADSDTDGGAHLLGYWSGRSRDYEEPDTDREARAHIATSAGELVDILAARQIDELTDVNACLLLSHQ